MQVGLQRRAIVVTMALIWHRYIRRLKILSQQVKLFNGYFLRHPILDLAQTGYLDQNDGYNEAWIGLSNTIDVNTYQWSDGTPFDYDGWAPNRPGVIGKPRCVPISADHIQDYESDYQLWYDLSCSSSMRAYVCKKSSYVNSC